MQRNPIRGRGRAQVVVAVLQGRHVRVAQSGHVHGTVGGRLGGAQGEPVGVLWVESHRACERDRHRSLDLGRRQLVGYVDGGEYAVARCRIEEVARHRYGRRNAHVGVEVVGETRGRHQPCDGVADAADSGLSESAKGRDDGRRVGDIAVLLSVGAREDARYRRQSVGARHHARGHHHDGDEQGRCEESARDGHGVVAWRGVCASSWYGMVCE
jgi:hypothetical protein